MENEECQNQTVHVITFSDLPDILSKTGVLLGKKKNLIKT